MVTNSEEVDLSAIEEGSPCPEQGCDGLMIDAEVENCSCHISPPCSACVDAGYECDKCGFQTAEAKLEPEYYEKPLKVIDRTGEITSTYTDNPFNSTPFTRCCGTAAIGMNGPLKHCPSCNAEITYHDDGLAERRRWAKGGCLMCGKPVGKTLGGKFCCC